MARQLPVFGVRDYRQVRLSRNLRDLLRRQAKREARQEFQADFELARRSQARLQRQRTRAVRGTRRVQAQGIEQLGQIGFRGLRGRDRREAASEVAAIQAGLAEDLPFQVRTTRAAFHPELQAVRDQLTGLRFDRLQTARTGFAERVAEARGQAVSELGARQKARGQTAEQRVERRQDLQKALTATRNIHTLEQGTAEGRRALQQNPEQYWNTIQQLTLKSEGVSDPRVAQIATAQLQERLRRQAVAEQARFHPGARSTLRGTEQLLQLLGRR